MGADLLGYMVVGPMRITDAKKKSAIEKATKEQSKWKELADVLEKGVSNAPKHLEKFSKVANIAAEQACDNDPLPYVRYMATADMAKEINTFVDSWNDCGYRDVCWRSDPSNSNRKIVFAGDMSWGDEPDGCGYAFLKQGNELNLFRFFGIK